MSEYWILIPYKKSVETYVHGTRESQLVCLRLQPCVDQSPDLLRSARSRRDLLAIPSSQANSQPDSCLLLIGASTPSAPPNRTILAKFDRRSSLHLSATTSVLPRPILLSPERTPRSIGAEVGGAMGIAQKAGADAAITFLWVFTLSSLGPVARAIALRLGLDGPGNGMLYIIFTLVSLHIFFFGFLGHAMGGATWNPTSSIAFMYAGVSKDDLFTLAATIPAQMAGAVGGVLAIQEVMPKPYKHMLSGPKLKVPVGTGVLAEALLTFTITLIVMWALLRGPKNPILKTFCIIIGTISLVAAGTPYTGPAMNPVNAFGWAFVTNPEFVTTWEHFAVYWAGPLFGTIAAVQVFNLLFGTQADYMKEIAAKKSKTLKKTPDADATKTKNVKGEADADDVAGKVKAS